MGGNCDKIGPNPDTSNKCNGFFEDECKLEGFCSKKGSRGSPYVAEWCDKITGREWSSGSRTGSCHYEGCHPYREQPSGCCKGCCGHKGEGTNCKRRAFRGDFLSCCFNDLYPCPTNVSHGNGCWSDGSSRKNTCDPCQRNITSTILTPLGESRGDDVTCADSQVRQGIPIGRPYTCHDILFDYCTGGDVPEGDISWTERWMDPTTGEPLTREEHGCMYAVLRNLYGQAACGKSVEALVQATQERCVPVELGKFTETESYSVPVGCDKTKRVTNKNFGFTWNEELLQAVFERYSKDGFTLGTLPGQRGYSPFQDFLYNYICCPFPILCQSALKSTCSIYSDQRISLNPSLANWCGCYLPEENYVKYVDVYQLDKPCTPTCNRPTSIPIVTGGNEAVVCDQDVCLIDDITINLIQSDVAGGIQISQMCGNCGSGVTVTKNGVVTDDPGHGACSCIIENNTINAVNASIGGNITIQNSCTGVTCTVVDPVTGENVTIPCDEVDSGDDPFDKAKKEAQEADDNAKRQRNLIVIIIVVVAIVIIIIAYILIKPRWGTHEDRLHTGPQAKISTGYTPPVLPLPPSQMSSTMFR